MRDPQFDILRIKVMSTDRAGADRHRGTAQPEPTAGLPAPLSVVEDHCLLLHK